MELPGFVINASLDTMKPEFQLGIFIHEVTLYDVDYLLTPRALTLVIIGHRNFKPIKARVSSSLISSLSKQI